MRKAWVRPLRCLLELLVRRPYSDARTISQRKSIGTATRRSVADNSWDTFSAMSLEPLVEIREEISSLLGRIERSRSQSGQISTSVEHDVNESIASVLELVSRRIDVAGLDALAGASDELDLSLVQEIVVRLAGVTPHPTSSFAHSGEPISWPRELSELRDDLTEVSELGRTSGPAKAEQWLLLLTEMKFERLLLCDLPDEFREGLARFIELELKSLKSEELLVLWKGVLEDFHGDRLSHFAEADLPSGFLETSPTAPARKLAEYVVTLRPALTRERCSRGEFSTPTAAPGVAQLLARRSHHGPPEEERRLLMRLVFLHEQWGQLNLATFEENLRLPPGSWISRKSRFVDGGGPAGSLESSSKHFSLTEALELCLQLVKVVEGLEPTEEQGEGEKRAVARDREWGFGRGKERRQKRRQKRRVARRGQAEPHREDEPEPPIGLTRNGSPPAPLGSERALASWASLEGSRMRYRLSSAADELSRAAFLAGVDLQRELLSEGLPALPIAAAGASEDTADEVALESDGYISIAALLKCSHPLDAERRANPAFVGSRVAATLALMGRITASVRQLHGRASGRVFHGQLSPANIFVSLDPAESVVVFGGWELAAVASSRHARARMDKRWAPLADSGDSVFLPHDAPYPDNPRAHDVYALAALGCTLLAGWAPEHPNDSSEAALVESVLSCPAAHLGPLNHLLHGIFEGLGRGHADTNGLWSARSPPTTPKLFVPYAQPSLGARAKAFTLGPRYRTGLDRAALFPRGVLQARAREFGLRALVIVPVGVNLGVRASLGQIADVDAAVTLPLAFATVYLVAIVGLHVRANGHRSANRSIIPGFDQFLHRAAHIAYLLGVCCTLASVLAWPKWACFVSDTLHISQGASCRAIRAPEQEPSPSPPPSKCAFEVGVDYPNNDIGLPTQGLNDPQRCCERAVKEGAKFFQTTSFGDCHLKSQLSPHFKITGKSSDYVAGTVRTSL